MPKERRERQHLASATHSVSEDGALLLLGKIGQARSKSGQRWWAKAVGQTQEQV